MMTKGHWVVQPRKDGSGFKTREAWLAEALGGRWVHRSHGYHLSSEARAHTWRRLVAAGVVCSKRYFALETRPYLFGLPPDAPTRSLREKLAMIP